MSKLELITPIEIKVIKMVCKELTTSEIALKLKLSPRTIESHRYRVMNRLKIKSNIGIVLFAVKHNLFKVKINKI
jgi:DNA-binding NarL/FixJ family response regulator